MCVLLFSSLGQCLADYYLNMQLCSDTSVKNKSGCLEQSIGKRNAFYMINDAAKSQAFAETSQPKDGQLGIAFYFVILKLRHN